jgi:hypothetical protein
MMSETPELDEPEEELLDDEEFDELLVEELEELELDEELEELPLDEPIWFPLDPVQPESPTRNRPNNKKLFANIGAPIND